jgi:hypothetical protein
MNRANVTLHDQIGLGSKSFVLAGAAGDGLPREEPLVLGVNIRHILDVCASKSAAEIAFKASNRCLNSKFSVGAMVTLFEAEMAFNSRSFYGGRCASITCSSLSAAPIRTRCHDAR